jgi:hypothetical protein
MADEPTRDEEQKDEELKDLQPEQEDAEAVKGGQGDADHTALAR